MNNSQFTWTSAALTGRRALDDQRLTFRGNAGNVDGTAGAGTVFHNAGGVIPAKSLRVGSRITTRWFGTITTDAGSTTFQFRPLLFNQTNASATPTRVAAGLISTARAAVTAAQFLCTTEILVTAIGAASTFAATATTTTSISGFAGDVSGATLLSASLTSDAQIGFSLETTFATSVSVSDVVSASYQIEVVY